MKKALLHITIASILTLIVYVLLSAIWGAILNDTKNQRLGIFILALLVTIAFALVLLYVSKITRSQAENEIVSDYKNREYASFAQDFMLAIKREYKMFACIALIVVCSFALNTFDRAVFGKKTISYITFIFIPMYQLDMVIDVPFVGYAVSAVMESAMYFVFLLIYRKKKYKLWFKNQMGRD